MSGQDTQKSQEFKRDSDSSVHSNGSLSSPTKRGFGARPEILMPVGNQDRHDLSIALAYLSAEDCAALKEIVMRVDTEAAACKALKEKFSSNDIWAHPKMRWIVTRLSHDHITLEELRRHLDGDKMPPEVPRIRLNTSGQFLDQLTKVLRNGPPGKMKSPPVSQDKPSQPMFLPKAETPVPSTPQAPPVVTATVKKDPRLDELLRMSQEEWERWVRAIFTPHMQSSYPGVFGLAASCMIEPKWTVAKDGKATRGIVVKDAQQPRSELSLNQDGSMSIRYKSYNNQDDARYLAMKFAGLLYAGRSQDYEKPVLVIDPNNFKYDASKPAERDKKKDFFEHIVMEFRKVGLGYELPDEPVLGHEWEEIKSWMRELHMSTTSSPQPSSRPFQRALGLGSCRVQANQGQDRQSTPTLVA